MRIFYAVGARPHGALTASRVWHNNLYLALRDLKHDIVQLDYDLEDHYANADITSPQKRLWNEIHRPILQRKLMQQLTEAHKQKKIDVFFSYFYSAFVDSETICKIRQMGIVAVNWFCNASYQFHLISDIASSYDYCLVPEKFRLEDYRHTGANPIYFQEAANPTIYRSYDLPKTYDVAFVGAEYGDRAAYIKNLIKHGLDVRVWGPGWRSLVPPTQLKRYLLFRMRRVKNIITGHKKLVSPTLPHLICGDPLSDDDMVKMYSMSKISLGFTKVGQTHLSDQPIKQVRLRDFEAPMSGAFYLVEHCDELEQFFIPNQEVVCFSDKNELIEKARYYLKHESEREKIRRAGQKRAQEEHSWQKRFTDAFKIMGMK
jgi:spore maturation protein CgeB